MFRQPSVECREIEAVLVAQNFYDDETYEHRTEQFRLWRCPEAMGQTSVMVQNRHAYFANQRFPETAWMMQRESGTKVWGYDVDSLRTVLRNLPVKQ